MILGSGGELHFLATDAGQFGVKLCEESLQYGAWVGARKHQGILRPHTTFRVSTPSQDLTHHRGFCYISEKSFWTTCYSTSEKITFICNIILSSLEMMSTTDTPFVRILVQSECSVYNN